jgi:beta-glucosidase
VPPKDGDGGLSPNVQLEGFQRIHLAPGQTEHVAFRLDPRELSEVDASGTRAVQSGSYTISIGGSQPKDALTPDSAQSASFMIVGREELPH